MGLLEYGLDRTVRLPFNRRCFPASHYSMVSTIGVLRTSGDGGGGDKNPSLASARGPLGG